MLWGKRITKLTPNARVARRVWTTPRTTAAPTRVYGSPHPPHHVGRDGRCSRRSWHGAGGHRGHASRYPGPRPRRRPHRRRRTPPLSCWPFGLGRRPPLASARVRTHRAEVMASTDDRDDDARGTCNMLRGKAASLTCGSRMRWPISLERRIEALAVCRLSHAAPSFSSASFRCSTPMPTVTTAAVYASLRSCTKSSFFCCAQRSRYVRLVPTSVGTTSCMHCCPVTNVTRRCQAKSNQDDVVRGGDAAGWGAPPAPWCGW